MALPTRCQTPGAEYQTRVQTGNDASPISLRASLSGNQSAYLPASLFSARSNDLSMNGGRRFRFSGCKGCALLARESL